MRTAIWGRSSRLGSGTLLALLAWFLIVSHSARAGCSFSYVPVVPDTIGFGLESLEHAGELAVAEAGGVPLRPKPCSGFGCSGRPTMPLSPTPVNILPLGTWAILEITTRPSAPEQCESHFDSGKFPLHSGFKWIFHPPRFLHLLLAS